MENKKAIIYAGIAVLLWSTVATAFKIALRNLQPFELMFYSSVFSTIILFIIVVIKQQLINFKYLKIKDYLLFAFLGLLVPFGYYSILFIAYDLLPAQIAQAINFTWPIAIVILSVIMKKEKLSILQFIAIFISFIGAYIVISGGDFKNIINFNIQGIIYAFLSVFIWAVYWLINRELNYDMSIALFFIFLFGSIYALITNAVFYSIAIPKISELIPALYVGLFEMSITFFVWLIALKSAKSTAIVNNVIYLTPFISLLIINYILKEIIKNSTIVGLFLIISGIILQLILKNKKFYIKN
ncbi:MAG: DMT family transporter [Candidatus Marinimicrobia bacterium]|nr:DMT family transporter [Candidatus Neomarinimicrobiota bacterium]